MSEKMSVERAAGILDPRHRERYESLAVVEDACSMGRDALLLRIPRSPHPDGDKSILSCPNCGSGGISAQSGRSRKHVLWAVWAGYFVGGLKHMTEKPKIPYNSQMAFAIAAGRDADASRIMAEAMGEIVGKACGFAQLFDFSNLPFVVAGMRAAANILENSMDEKSKVLADNILSHTRYVTVDAAELKRQMEAEEGNDNGNA